MIDRRAALVCLGLAVAAWPLSATSQQQPALPVIGFLTSHLADGYGRQRLAAVRNGLAEVGFVEGKNVAIEVRWGEGRYDRLPAMAADLVDRQVRVIVTDTTPALLAVKAATATIPIVFALATDPVALGLVSSLARPGGNITGATRLNVELGPKRLQLMREIVPSATSMALLVNPANPSVTEAERRGIEAAARTLGLELQVLEAGDERGIDEAFATAARSRAGALVISADSYFGVQHARLGALTVRHGLPTISLFREFVAAGGLIGYAGSSTDASRITGVYAGRILKGERPADLPAAVDQDRDVHQPEDRQGARRHRADHAAGAGRRDLRIARVERGEQPSETRRAGRIGCVVSGLAKSSTRLAPLWRDSKARRSTCCALGRLDKPEDDRSGH